MKFPAYKVFLVIGFALAFSAEMKASHIVGGEITYRCLGNNNYEIAMTIYRDCFFGVPFFDNPAVIGFYDENNQLVEGIGEDGRPYIQTFVRNNDTLSPVLENACDVIPPHVCVHTTTYLDTVQLPFISGGYQLVYQRCCRNQTIANIVDPSETGGTYVGSISEYALLNCNSSPTFKDWPPLYICANEPIDFDHSATDIDGDSLVYILCEPLAGNFPGSPRPVPPNPPPHPPVEWVEPLYGLDNMLGGTDPLRIDPQTGWLTGTPTILGQFVVGICVEEYKDGELIGTTRRDFQYNVGVCGQTSASFFAAENYCDQLEVPFENLSENALGTKWIFGDPENPLDTSVEFEPVYTFPDYDEWQVTLISFGNTPACNDTFSRTINLLNVELDVEVDIERGMCTDSLDLSLLATVDGSVPGNNSFNWNVEWNNEQLSGSGEKLDLTVSGVDTINVSLRVINDEFNCWKFIDFPLATGFISNDGMEFNYNICEGDSVFLNPDFTPGDEYLWAPAQGIIDSLTSPNPLASPEAPSRYTATITNGTCEGEISAFVNVINGEYRLVPELICNNRRIELQNPFPDSDDEFRWFLLRNGNLVASTQNPNPIYSLPAEGEWEILYVSEGKGENCPDTIRNLFSLYSVDLDLNVERGSCKDSLELFLTAEADSIDISNSTFTWIVDGDSTFTQGPRDTVFVSGQESVQIKVIMNSLDPECVTQATVQFETYVVSDEVDTEELYFCPGDTIQLNTELSTDYDYQWMPDDFLLDSSNVRAPDAAPDSSITYTALVSYDMCSMEFIVEVVELESESFNLPDLKLCGRSEVEFELPAQATGHGFVWIFGDPQNPLEVSRDTNPIITFPDFGEWEVRLVNFANLPSCIDTFFRTMELVDVDLNFEVDVIRGECTDKLELTLVAESDSAIAGTNNFSWKVMWGDQLLIGSDDSLSFEVSGVEEVVVELKVFNDEFNCTQTLEFPISTGFVQEDGEEYFQSLCLGDSLHLNPGFISPNSNYEWTPIDGFIDSITSKNPLVSPEESTTYVANITIGTCSGQITSFVEVVSSDFPLVPDTLCNQRRVEFTNPFPNLQGDFEWLIIRNGNVIGTLDEPNPSILFPTFGDYEVFFVPTDAPGNCPDTIKSSIHLLEKNVDLIVERGTCQDSLELFLELESDSATLANSTFTWIVGEDTITTAQPNLRFFVSGVDEVDIKVIVDKFNATCEVSAEMTITTELITGIDESQEITICRGDTINLNPNISPNFNYNWMPTDFLIDSANSPNPRAAPINNIIYTTGINNSICSTSFEVEVKVIGGNFELPHDTLCEIQDVRFELPSDFEASGFEWIFGNPEDPIATSTNPNPVISFPGQGSWDVFLNIFEFGQGCTFTIQGSVTILEQKDDAEIIIIRERCENGELELTLEAVLDSFDIENYEVEWTISGDTQLVLNGPDQTLILKDLENITIELVLTDPSTGCQSEAILEYETAIPTDFIKTDTLFICRGDTVAINPDFNSNYDYVWSPATGMIDPVTTPNPLVSPNDTTLYTAAISSGDCTAEQSVLVVVHEVPQITNITANPESITMGENSMLFVEVVPPDVDLQWFPPVDLDNPFVNNPVASPDETTEFTVVAENEYGCLASASITLLVSSFPCEVPYVFLPNAFSPNGDGENDVLYLRGSHIERFTLVIYNRWGQEVFRTSELEKGWDGTFKGEAMAPDVYGYYLEVECIGGEQFSNQGNVSLIR